MWGNDFLRNFIRNYSRAFYKISFSSYSMKLFKYSIRRFISKSTMDFTKNSTQFMSRNFLQGFLFKVLSRGFSMIFPWFASQIYERNSMRVFFRTTLIFFFRNFKRATVCGFLMPLIYLQFFSEKKKLLTFF